ncbi:MAG: hypothetical protein PHS66_07820 [Candidatus Omnitrophica bacterium]|nr:hypothetical protein [Candidatus Omnitrophota bacterium]
MEKKLFLIAFFMISVNLVFAQDPQFRTFEIGDGGIVKIMPEGGMVDVQIIYNKISDAPEPVKEKLGINVSSGKLEFVPLQFSIKLLNAEGAVVCRQVLLFSDFTVDETTDQPKAVLSYRAGGQCSGNYDKINSVSVDYSNITG